MDFSFDAPQFVDFTNQEHFEEDYKDDWFQTHPEYGVPQRQEACEKTTQKPRRSQQLNPNSKPQRILKHSVSDNHLSGCPNTNQHMKSYSRMPLKSSQEENRMSPPKKSRQSNEKMKVKKEDSSPAANTRSQRRQSADGGASPNSRVEEKAEEQALGQNNEDDVESPLGSRPPCTGKTQASSPVQEGAKNKSPRAGMRRSPRKIPKSPRKTPRESPFKAPKHIPSPSKRINGGVKSTMLKRSGSSASSRPNAQELRKYASVGSLKGKTTEDLELERIQEMKRANARKLKEHQESYKKTQQSSGYVPVRSAQPATMPEGFHFKTDGRLKTQTSARDLRVKEFTQSLRDALPNSNLGANKTSRNLTKPQPFKLSKSKSCATSVNKFKSDAEKVAAFHTKTPERFRTKAKVCTRSGSSSRDQGARAPSPGLTQPKTPNLSTRGRARPAPHIPTHEEMEMREYEEHAKQQFKAHPVNRKVLDGGPVGLAKVDQRPLTVPEEFNLHHKHAMSQEDIRLKHEEERPEFHARPFNPKIMKGPTGVKPANQLPVTVPKSPAFALKNRVKIPIEIPQVEENKPASKVHAVPHPGVPFKPRLEHHHTVPQPFSVEERSRQMMEQREKKIQRVLDEERKAREFRAQGYRDAPDALPPKQERPLTAPEPFNLACDDRGEKYKATFTREVEEEQRQLREASKFKAKPSTVLQKDPFQPQKSMKPLTELSDLRLHTEQRMTQREDFDNFIKFKEAELEGLKRQRKDQRLQEEEEEVQRMRQQAVHKAQGIKKYTSVVVKPSDKPLTAAQSPAFSTRNRLNRHNISDNQ